MTIRFSKFTKHLLFVTRTACLFLGISYLSLGERVLAQTEIDSVILFERKQCEERYKAAELMQQALLKDTENQLKTKKSEIERLHLQIEILRRDIAVLKDSLLQFQRKSLACADSLNVKETKLMVQQQQLLLLKIDSVRMGKKSAEWDVLRGEMQNRNDTLQLQNAIIKQMLNEKNALLERQIAILKEKETIFTEKEQLYKEAINASDVDKVKLSGNLDLKNESLKGKEKEIAYLYKSVSEKDSAISKRDEHLLKLTLEKNRFYQQNDTLREKLAGTEKELLQIKEELKYTERRAKEAEARIAQATNRKKKVRVIQGLGMKLYRTPQWDMMPIAQNGSYVNSIVNRNAGWAEFDFVTGASVMLLDLSTDSARFSSDLGIYVGFGGSNLFKNFYVGVNYKFLDFFHLAAGVNIAEYKVLASGYKEGDVLPVGIAIQTVNEWKMKPFISFAVDLEFLSYVGKK